MRIEEKAIEFALRLERRLFYCDNKELSAIIEKSLIYLADKLSKDWTPKESLDKGDEGKIASYFSLKTSEEKLTFLFNAAMEGSANAQSLIAGIYYDGRTYSSQNGEITFHQNRRLSALWEFLAAMNGLASAQYEFAYKGAFSLGKYDGVRMSIEDGLTLMEFAANQGLSSAERFLTGVYLGSEDDSFWKQYMNIEKGIAYALKLRKKGVHDFDELIEKYY